ncbi:MAG: hypothetical protein ACHP84_17275 [Caulobacterales bacterium]
MTRSQAQFDAGFRAGVLTVLHDWRQRSRILILAFWVLFCLPVGAFTLMGHTNNAFYYAPLVVGTAMVGYFFWLVDRELTSKIKLVEAAATAAAPAPVAPKQALPA